MQIELTGKKILVTGAQGFVGSHLVKELQSRAAGVVTLETRGENSIDLRCWQELGAFMSKLGKRDIVYQLAALMFVPYSFEDPRETYDVNILGTLDTLELCRLLT